jgi:hypothetical protein
MGGYFYEYQWKAVRINWGVVNNIWISEGFISDIRIEE